MCMSHSERHYIPASISPSENGWHGFTFHYNPDIATCIVTGPNCNIYGPYLNVGAADIRTQLGETRFTTGSAAGGQRTFATILWGYFPVVEIKGMTPHQGEAAGQFLCLQLESDQQTSYRRMDVGGKSYKWIERGSAGTYLYKEGDEFNVDPVAHIRMINPRMLVLKLRGEAFPAGLFQPCIAATVLLYSGRNFG